MSVHPYDEAYAPPAPVAPVRLAAPDAGTAVLVSALIDSGADLTVIPVRLARLLGLSATDRVTVRGVAGSTHSVEVCAARVEFDGVADTIEILPLDHEALLGRNALRTAVVTLDGRRGETTIHGASSSSDR